MKGNLETIEVFSAMTELRIARMLYSSGQIEAARDGVQGAIKKLEGWLGRDAVLPENVCDCGHSKHFHAPLVGCVEPSCECEGFGRSENAG